MSKTVPLTTVLTLACAATVSAATVSYSPASITDTGWKTCTVYAGASCRTTAFFDTTGLYTENSGDFSSLFQSAFIAWNATGGVGGQGWTLSQGAALAGTFDVTISAAEQFNGSNAIVTSNVSKGGLEIRISTTNITLPTLGTGDQYVWTQGLYDNYLLNGSIVTPFYEMDIATGACTGAGPTTYCPPAYPFQYADKHFYDQPIAGYKASGTQAFFDANAYLAIENNGTKTLTIYDGVSYGFQNFVSPEPSAWILCGGGLLLLIVLKRRTAPTAANV